MDLKTTTVGEMNTSVGRGGRARKRGKDSAPPGSHSAPPPALARNPWLACPGHPAAPPTPLPRRRALSPTPSLHPAGLPAASLAPPRGSGPRRQRGAPGARGNGSAGE